MVCTLSPASAAVRATGALYDRKIGAGGRIAVSAGSASCFVRVGDDVDIKVHIHFGSAENHHIQAIDDRALTMGISSVAHEADISI